MVHMLSALYYFWINHEIRSVAVASVFFREIVVKTVHSKGDRHYSLKSWK